MENISWWHWWLFGIGFFILEILLPGIIFMWFGVAALVMGVVILAFSGIPWEVQLITFSLLSIGSAIGWRIYQKNNPVVTDNPDLNQRGRQYQGQIITLSTSIQNGTGKARVGDSFWTVNGPDLEEGSSVKVVGSKGTVLVVEAVSE